MKRAVWVASLLVFTACAAVDRPTMSEFEPMGDSSFRFQAKADAIYPEASPAAESERMRWLQTYLDNNGLCRSGYELTDRKVVLVSEALLGDLKTIYYQGRCT